MLIAQFKYIAKSIASCSFQLVLTATDNFKSTIYIYFSEISTVDEGEIKTGKWVVNSGAGIRPYGRQCRRNEDLFL